MLYNKLKQLYYPVNKKKLHRMTQIINEVFEYAADEDRQIVLTNTWQRAKKKINPKRFLNNREPLHSLKDGTWHREYPCHRFGFLL